MKVNGTGQPTIPDASATEAAEKVAKLNETVLPGESPGTGKAFNEKLAGAGPVQKTRLSEPPPGGRTSRSGDVAVSDLAAELRAGKLTPEAAVDQLLERVVAGQVGPDASAALRDQVRVALRDAIESDPVLAAKVSGLR
jgi:hypothetical protein